MDDIERKRTAKTDDEKLLEKKRKEENPKETNKKDEESYKPQDVISRLTQFQLSGLIVERIWANLDWKSLKNACLVNTR